MPHDTIHGSEHRTRTPSDTSITYFEWQVRPLPNLDTTGPNLDTTGPNEIFYRGRRTEITIINRFILLNILYINSRFLFPDGEALRVAKYPPVVRGAPHPSLRSHTQPRATAYRKLCLSSSCFVAHGTKAGGSVQHIYVSLTKKDDVQ